MTRLDFCYPNPLCQQAAASWHCHGREHEINETGELRKYALVPHTKHVSAVSSLMPLSLQALWPFAAHLTNLRSAGGCHFDSRADKQHPPN